MRRSIFVFVCALLGASAAFAQSSRATSIIVPFSAGGQNDVVARIVAQPLGDALKTTVVVENLPGAGGVIAARKMLSSPADGLAIFQGTPSQLVLAGLVNKELVLNTADFVPIHLVGTSPYVIFARSGLKASNADELAALARQAAADGKPLTYASVGTGTLNHVLGEELARRIGAPLLHVPYKGGAEVMRDLAGGQVDIFLNLYTAQQIALANDGRLKFIAALSPGRQQLLPNLPSVDEGTALKGFYSELWIGLFVKAGTPPATIATLNKAMATVLATPSVQQALLHQTGTVAATPTTSPAAVEAQYQKGIKQFQDLAKSAGLQAAK